jgi:hypothetical protein
MTLAEALDYAAAHGGALAVSVPNGAYIALRVQGHETVIRRVATQSGQDGSVAGTGAWLSPADVAPTVLWRPA